MKEDIKQNRKMYPYRTISVRMDDLIFEKLDYYCFKNKISKNKIITECLSKHLENDYFKSDPELVKMKNKEGK